MWHDQDRDMHKVAQHFDADALTRICSMPERKFGTAFGMGRHLIETERAPDNFYYFRDNGADVLAVAHLDTVAHPQQRKARIVQTEAGLVVHSRALDDRLGAYVILELLPKLGINYDVLLTVGEESGNSTAQHFDPTKQYDWMIEFDRGGTDVVMYQYDDVETRGLVKDSGAEVGEGIFSDICFLDHLDVKGFNWGVGYQDYHFPRAHAYLDDTFSMVARYLRFHEMNEGTFMPHYPRPSWRDRSPWWASGEPDEEAMSADDINFDRWGWASR